MTINKIDFIFHVVFNRIATRSYYILSKSEFLVFFLLVPFGRCPAMHSHRQSWRAMTMIIIIITMIMMTYNNANRNVRARAQRSETISQSAAPESHLVLTCHVCRCAETGVVDWLTAMSNRVKLSTARRNAAFSHATLTCRRTIRWRWTLSDLIFVSS